MDALDLLPRIAGFSRLPRALLKELAGLSGVQRLAKGSILFREHDRPHFVYGLVEGRISLTSGSVREETITDFVGPGDVVLIPPALLQLPYMVSARALTDIVVIMIPAGEFRRLAETALPLSVAVGKILAQHWRVLLAHLIQSRIKDADSRLVHFLLENAGSAPGRASLKLPASKQDIAAHLGITPATLSRSLKRLSRIGVKTARDRIEIESVRTLGTHLEHLRRDLSPAP